MIAALLVVVTAELAGVGPAQSLEITVIGTPADLERVRDLADPARLGGAPPRWARADRFDPTEVLRPGTALRCWVDFSHRQWAKVRVTFAARSGQRFLVREVALSDRFDELDRQSLAQVLELSVAALLEDELAGLSRVEAQALLLPPEPPPPTTAPATPPARRRLRPGVFYGGKALGAQFPIVHGPGLSLEWAGTRAPLGWSAWIEAQAQLPYQAQGASVGLRFFTVAARAGLGLVRSLESEVDAGISGPALRLQRLVARLGMGMDFVRLSPQSGTTDGPTMLEAARWSESLVFCGALGLGVGVGSALGIELRLIADVLPTTVHYDLATEGEVRPVFSPWRIRPGVALGLNL